MSRAALLMLLLLAASAQADDLGRLFFSAAERARLDAERLAPPLPAETEDVNTPDSPADAAAIDAPLMPSPPVTVNGLVLRAHGPSTAWINGAPATRRDLATGEGRELRIARDAVEVRDPLARARVKPGQTFEPDAGRVVEGYTRPPTAAPDSR